VENNVLKKNMHRKSIYKFIFQTPTEINKQLTLNTRLQLEHLHVFFRILSDSNAVHSYK